MPSFDNIGDKITEIFVDWLKDLINLFIEFLQNSLFNYDGLAGYALDAYNLFVFFGGILLVSVCLGKVITQLLSESEGSEEANIWWTIVRSVKASALLVIMPLVISLTMNYIVQPIGNYFIGNMGELTTSSLVNTLQAENLPDVFSAGITQVVIWLFIFVVIGFFVIKLFIEQAQLLIDEILSPLCAISVVTENYNFMENWWRDILSHTVTIIVLTLSMLLFTEAITMQTDTVWGKLPALIGSGALVISGPSIVKSIWYSSGAGRAGSGMARSVVHRMLR